LVANDLIEPTGEWAQFLGLLCLMLGANELEVSCLSSKTGEDCYAKLAIAANTGRSLKATWQIFCLMSHQSAEPCMSINRLRCRLRSHTATTQATAIMHSPAPTMTPVESQALVASDVHSFPAPSVAANTTIPVATLIPERAF
jgi:hypothetical protein